MTKIPKILFFVASISDTGTSNKQDALLEKEKAEQPAAGQVIRVVVVSLFTMEGNKSTYF
jgi:hypothetical protein